MGAREAWGCPALPASADRFARRSCCEVCGGSTGCRGGWWWHKEGLRCLVWGLPRPYVGNLAKSLCLLFPKLPHDSTLGLCTWHGQPELAGTLRPHWC